MDRKNNKDAATPTAIFRPSPQSGCRDGKTAPARFQVTSKKIKIQLQSIWMLIPKIFPILKPLRIFTSETIEYYFEQIKCFRSFLLISFDSVLTCFMSSPD